MSYERLYAGETPTVSFKAEYAPESEGATPLPVPKSAITEVYFSGADAASGDVVNDRDAETNRVADLEDANLTIGDTNGVIEWKGQPEDTNLLRPIAGGEEHRFELRVVHDGGESRFVHRIHCTEFLGFASLDEVAVHCNVKDDDGNIDPDTQLFLELAIDAVTALVQRKTGRIFLKATPENPAVEIFSPYNQRKVQLRRWPVTKEDILTVAQSSVGDFSLDGEGNHVTATVVDPSKYGVVAQNWVALRDGCFNNGVGTLEIRHTGGEARHAGGIDADLRWATVRQVGTWWNTKDQLGKTGAGIQGSNVTWFFKGGLIKDLTELIPHLKPKRRII